VRAEILVYNVQQPDQLQTTITAAANCGKSSIVTNSTAVFLADMFSDCVEQNVACTFIDCTCTTDASAQHLTNNILSIQ